MKQFYKTALLSLFFWTVCFGGLIYHIIFHPILKQGSSKFVKYRTSREMTTPVAIFQSRQGISKDLWISSKETRVFCHIESPTSTLQFIRENTKPSLVESLSQLKIWIQEPKEIKYLKATNGDFNYTKHSLASHEAFLSSYKIGNSSNTIFSCTANDLSIAFDESPLSFNASGFSAHLQSGESL